MTLNMSVYRGGIRIPQLATKQIHSYTARLVRSPCSVVTPPQHRELTNASKIDYVDSLQNVKLAPAKPGGWKPTLIHSSGEVKFTVIRVEPGGEVPPHFHNQSWDYFVPLDGDGLIETKTEDGEQKAFPMKVQSFLAVPPKDVHRVRNASHEKEFVFLIAQSPRAIYDFVDAE